MTKTIDDPDHPIIQLALLLCSSYTSLPELYAIFGKARLLELIEIFSNTTIKIPSKQIIGNAIMKSDIYHTLSNQDGDLNAKLDRLSHQYDITPERVLELYGIVQVEVEHLIDNIL